MEIMYFDMCDRPKQNVVTYPTGWGDELYYHTDIGIKHIPTRTKYSHPYSYDPIVQYDNGKESNGSVYTDRLMQWDYEKYNKCALKHFGDTRQYFDRLTPKQIQAFLREYLDDKKLILVKSIEMCNASNGFPLWLLQYKGSKNV